MKQILIIFLITLSFCSVQEEDKKIQILQEKLQKLQFGYENLMTTFQTLQQDLHIKKKTQALLDSKVAKLRNQEQKNLFIDKTFEKLDMFKNIKEGYNKMPKIVDNLHFIQKNDQETQKTQENTYQNQQFKQVEPQQQVETQYQVEDFESEIEENNLRKELGI